MVTTIRLENGLRKLNIASITKSGYGEIFTVTDMTSISCETSEGDMKLAAGNAVK